MAEEPSKFMTLAEACTYLGIKRSTIDLYVRQGRLKRFQQGAPRQTVFLREQVVRLKEPKPK